MSILVMEALSHRKAHMEKKPANTDAPRPPAATRGAPETQTLAWARDPRHKPGAGAQPLPPHPPAGTPPSQRHPPPALLKPASSRARFAVSCSTPATAGQPPCAPSAAA